jgi:hypothetical protein
MGLGSRLFGRLLRANATVTVQYAKSDPTGGTTNIWTAVVSGVDVLVTQAAGGRDLGAGMMTDRNTFSVAGVHPSLARPDVRLLVTAAGVGLTHLEGRYLSVTSGQTHPAGSGGLLGARVNLQCVVMEAPMDTATTL